MSAHHDAYVRDALDRIALQTRRIADNLERLVYTVSAYAEDERRRAAPSADIIPFHRRPPN